jgi:hypothetical protein
MNAPIKYGPWSADDETERRCQLRSLVAIAHLQLGPQHPVVHELRAADNDPIAFVRAQELIEALPALTRRGLLATFSSVNRPPKRSART